MPDISSMLKAIKLSWLKRLSGKQTSFSKFASTLVGQQNLLTFLQYKGDVKYLNMPSFYKQLFQYWFEIHSRPPEGPTEILDEILWYNKRILVDNRPVFFKTWNEHGIKRISHILKSNGIFYTPLELNNLYSINVNIMSYNSLKAAVPSEWMQNIRNNPIDNYIHSQDGDIFVKLGEKSKNALSVTCKDFYEYFVQQKKERPTALYKWEEMYYFADFDWNMLYCIPYRVVRETDIQSLQYQIINRYIPCYVNLYKWGKEHSSSCPLCNQTDTIEHYFVECTSINCFWSEISSLIQLTYDISLNLNTLDILFGVPFEDPIFTIVNFCILHCKKYIHKCRISKEHVHYSVFKKKFRNRVLVELTYKQKCEQTRNLLLALLENL